VLDTNIVVPAARRQQVPGMRRRRMRRLPGARQPAAFSEVLEEDQRDHVARLHQHRSAALDPVKAGKGRDSTVPLPLQAENPANGMTPHDRGKHFESFLFRNRSKINV
jgi:hypothetical protein